MKIIFVGDIVGRPGRDAVKVILPKLIEKHQPDFVFANGENLTSGRGMKLEHYEEMIKSGVDYFTSGNHIWDNKDFIPQLSDQNVKVLRPANYPTSVVGRGFVELEKIVLINLMGRIFTVEGLDCPFRKFDQIYDEVRDTGKPIIVDFHAEATSEKRAFAEYVSGRATAVVGTHTHVQTNDEQILNDTSVFVTDIGMVGPKDAVLGVGKEQVIGHFLTAMPWKLEVARGPVIFNAALIEIDSNNKPKSIELVKEELE